MQSQYMLIFHKNVKFGRYEFRKFYKQKQVLTNNNELITVQSAIKWLRVKVKFVQVYWTKKEILVVCAFSALSIDAGKIPQNLAHLKIQVFLRG